MTTSHHDVPVLQVNAAVCSTSTMVHYVDASTATSLRAINGVREFMSETFKTTWASHLDKVRRCRTPAFAYGLCCRAGRRPRGRWSRKRHNNDQFARRRLHSVGVATKVRRARHADL